MTAAAIESWRIQQWWATQRHARTPQNLGMPSRVPAIRRPPHHHRRPDKATT